MGLSIYKKQPNLTFMMVVANLAYTKWCKKPLKNMTETLEHVYSSESSLQELSNEYQHGRV